MEKKILILDIETTGFLQSGGKIVEVGIVELNLEDGSSNIIYDKVVQERFMKREEIEKAWIVKNSNLTADEVMNAAYLDEEMDEIQSIIDKYEYGSTAFNNVFDFGFLESRGLIFPKKLACPMKLSTNICKLPGRSGYKWPKVEEAYKHFFPEESYIEKHRGADDALHEAKIVYKLYQIGVFKA